MMAFAMQAADSLGGDDEQPAQARTTRKPKTPAPVAETDDEDAAQAVSEPDDDAADPAPDAPDTEGVVEEEAEPASEEDGAVLIPDDEDGTGTDGEGKDDDEPKERRLSDLPEWAQQEIRDKIKLREQRRELREQLAEKDKALAETQKKLEAQATGYTAQVPGFEQFKAPEDIDQATAAWQRDVEWAEDNEDGWSGEIDGNPVEYTRQQVREYRRRRLRMIEAAAKAKETMLKHQATASETSALAKKKYPHFFDANHARNNLLLDQAQKFPELNASPAKALLLARSAIGELLESGAYKLVKVERPNNGKQAATPASAAPSKPKPPPVPVPPRPAARTDTDLAARLRAGDRDAQEEWAARLVGD